MKAIRLDEPRKFTAIDLPEPDAPVWPMDAFRDRFLDAFSTG